MTRTHRRTTAEPSRAHPEREREMAELGIGYDGVRYAYNGYRYGQLSDAVAYASLMLSRPAQQDAGGPFKSPSTFSGPTDADRTLMAALAIDFRDGAYRFGGYRYDVLADAVNYAKLMRERQDRS